MDMRPLPFFMAACATLLALLSACADLKPRKPLQPIIETERGMLLSNMAAVLLRKEGYTVELPSGLSSEVDSRPLLMINAKKQAKGLLSGATPKDAPGWLKGLGTVADILGKQEDVSMSVALAKVQGGYAVELSGGHESSEAFAQRLAEACQFQMHLFKAGDPLVAEAKPRPSPTPFSLLSPLKYSAPEKRPVPGTRALRPTPVATRTPHPSRSIMLFGPQATPAP